MSLTVIHTIRILGIQSKDYNTLNRLIISISSDNIIQKLTKYRKYRYRFVLESLLFSSTIKNETDIIFVSCDAKEALINSKLETVLGVRYLSQLKDWELVADQSKISQAVSMDSEHQTKYSNFAFAFVTRNNLIY